VRIVVATATLGLAACCLTGCALGSASPASGPRAALASPAAAPAGATPAPAPPSAPNPRRVTILALDMSGSMHQNDPRNIRCAAARTFVDLSRPGEMVGLIGFADRAATVWQAPIETTAPNRALLDAAITRNCRLGDATPTYSALQDALQMLTNAPGRGPRSVVLLTDGKPTGSPADQVGRIERDLVPTFHEKGWPIDTIALGHDTDFEFLRRISASTGGDYTDARDANALSLLPAFVRAIEREPGRSPGRTVPAGTLEFTVPPSNHLDVVVVCREQCSGITLRSPAGAPVTDWRPIATGADQTRYGAVFFVPDPPYDRDSPWTVQVPAGADVRVQSIVDLQLDVDVQPLPPPHVVGRALDVEATVNDLDGHPHPDDRLTLDATLIHTGGGAVAEGTVKLRRAGGARYSGSVVVPKDESAGSYDVTVRAYTDLQVAAKTRRIDVGIVPEPTGVDASASVVAWPWWTAVYRLPVLDRFSGWAIGDRVPPMASIGGALVGPTREPYRGKPVVGAEVVAPGSRAAVPAVASADGSGRFRVWFPAPRAGRYAITLRTGGQDSLGQSIATPVTVSVTSAAATPAQVFRGGLATLVLVVALLVALAYLRFCTLRPPYGALVPEDDGPRLRLGLRRSPLRALLWRNRVYRRDGLEFAFGYLSGIRVRRRRRRVTPWRRADGGELSTRFSPERQLLLSGVVHTVVAPEDDVHPTLGRWPGLALRVAARAIGVPNVRAPRPSRKRQRRGR
jgi:von Willebrand factor type A domain